MGSLWLFNLGGICYLRLRDQGNKARELAMDLHDLSVPHQEVLNPALKFGVLIHVIQFTFYLCSFG